MGTFHLRPHILSAIFIALFVVRTTFAFPAKFGAAPDNNQELLISFLNSAKKTILINSYQLDHPLVTEAIKKQILAGITIKILVEGEPVGKISKASRQTLDKIFDAMENKKGENHLLYLMVHPKDGKNRRFTFDHAKYVVIDSKSVLISSENFSRTGHPSPHGIGNRGWDIEFENPEIAQELEAIFYSDLDPGRDDIIEYTPKLQIETRSFDQESDSISFQPLSLTGFGWLKMPIGIGEIDSSTLIVSPKSLPGILKMIQTAREDLQIEELSLPLYWYSGQSRLNPIVDELVKAAERGVVVRILLNDDQVFRAIPDPTLPNSLKGNALTIQHLENLRIRKKLPIYAKTINIKSLGIHHLHNKGIVADHQYVWIGSINGTQNSVMNNREVAICVESKDAGAYYSQAFSEDWKHS